MKNIHIIYKQVLRNLGIFMASDNLSISQIEFDDWQNWKNEISNSNSNEELSYIAETHDEWYIRALATIK